MLKHYTNFINMSDKIKSHMKREFRNCSFSSFFFNWIISVINRVKLTKFGRHVVEGHWEGTVSQTFYLGPSFNFMKSRKLRGKKL